MNIGDGEAEGNKKDFFGLDLLKILKNNNVTLYFFKMTPMT